MFASLSIYPHQYIYIYTCIYVYNHMLAFCHPLISCLMLSYPVLCYLAIYSPDLSYRILPYPMYLSIYLILCIYLSLSIYLSIYLPRHLPIYHIYHVASYLSHYLVPSYLHDLSMRLFYLDYHTDHIYTIYLIYLAYLILSYHTLSCLIFYIILSYLLYYPVLSYLILSYPMLCIYRFIYLSI